MAKLVPIVVDNMREIITVSNTLAIPTPQCAKHISRCTCASTALKLHSIPVNHERATLKNLELRIAIGILSE